MNIVSISTQQELIDVSADLLERAAALSDTDAAVNVALPGGRSVAPVLMAIRALDRQILSRMHFYLIDERVDEQRNADMLQDVLFAPLMSSGSITANQIHMPTFSGDAQFDASQYAQLLPRLHMVVAGSGEDGHIASLFPDRDDAHKDELAVLVEHSPKAPARRISLTHRAFRENGKGALYLLLFLGEAKAAAYRDFLREDADPQRIPAAFLKEFDELTVAVDHQASVLAGSNGGTQNQQ